MKRDYLTTFLAEGFVLATALLMYRSVAIGYGTVGFAEYAVARRTLTLLLPLCVLGLDVALPRLIAYAASASADRARGYLVSALPIALTGTAITSLVLMTTPQLVSEVFFGSPDQISLVGVLPVLLAGATAHVLVYGHLRGRGSIFQANALMTVNHAATPLGALVVGKTVGGILVTLGLGWLAASAVAFVIVDKSMEARAPAVRDLARMGTQRVPGDLVQLLFFSLPVIAAARLGGLNEAGVVAFGITALGMIGSSLTPIGFVLLPVAARQMGKGSVASLRRHVVEILRLLAPLVVIGVAIGEVFADQIVGRYLGAQFAATVTPLRLILLGALPWSAYILLRSIVDARHERAVNARNMLVGFTVFAIAGVVVAATGGGLFWVLTAFVLGLLIVGLLTSIDAYRALQTDGLAVEASPASLEVG